MQFTRCFPVPPEVMREKFHFPPSREGGCPSCSAQDTAIGCLFNRQACKKSRSFVICRQTQLHFQLFALKSFQIPGMLCRQLRGPRAPHGFPRPARLETRGGGLVTPLKELQVRLGSRCPSRCAGGSPACLPWAVSEETHTAHSRVCRERDWAKDLSRWEEEHFDLLPSCERPQTPEDGTPRVKGDHAQPWPLSQWRTDSERRLKMSSQKEKEKRGFPAGPVVWNPPCKPCSAGDAGSIPGQRTEVPCAAEQLRPRAATTEPPRSGAGAPLQGPCVTSTESTRSGAGAPLQGPCTTTTQPARPCRVHASQVLRPRAP